MNSNIFSPKLPKTMEIFKLYPTYQTIFLNTNKIIITKEYSESIWHGFYLYFSLVNKVLLNMIRWAI